MSKRDLDDFNGKNWSSWILRIFLLLLVAAAVGAGIIYREQVAEAATRLFSSADAEPIPVVTAHKTPFRLEVPAYGEVIGMETTGVPTPSVRAGSLKLAWLIPEGTLVETGDVLMRFDSTEAKLSLEKQLTSMESTEKSISLTRNNQTTNQKLLNIDQSDAQKEYDYAMNVMPEDETIFSRWEIIEAQINAGLAKEKMSVIGQKLKVNKRSAQADMQILNIDKSKTKTEMEITQQTLDALELRAPKSGLAVYRRERMRDPQVGDELQGGQVVVELVDLTLLQARVYILEMDAGEVAKGQPVIVHLDSINDKDFNGTVKSIAALAQTRERNSPLKYFECDILIRDVGADLRRIKPGMALKSRIVLDQYDSVFVVPNSAVTFKENNAQVFVRSGKDFTARDVKLGSRNHGQTVVLDGLKESEKVAMRNPFENRKARLPDFSKATASGRRGPGPGGPGGMGGMDIRIMIGGPGGGGGGSRGRDH